MIARVTFSHANVSWLTGMGRRPWVNSGDHFSAPPHFSMSDAQDDVSRDLLGRLAQRDAAALAAACDHFGRTIYSIAYRVLGQAGDVEEAVQDAFRALWRNAGKLRDRQAKVLPWLITTARRAAIDTLRRRKSRIPSAASIAEEEMETENRVSGDEPTAGEALLQKERAQAVRTAVQSLPEEQQQMVRLAFFSGLTHQEISDRLQVPLGTVKSRLRYGLQKLQQKITEVSHD
jgi:RNA polymerase sigma factor (sigma-70 family)